jgi:hypothetical protein
MKFPLTMCLAQAVLSHSGNGRGMSSGVGTTASIDFAKDKDSGRDTLGAAELDTELIDGWWSAATADREEAAACAWA